ncbi:mannitol dehydrogenase family protein [Algoriphagus mannitolivorans]|uniref:mannitol dehydrogenase family protein n=1 Tax=Algoriphagus mannitolivorans TaxID=226504 RepID=UPI0003FA3D15|nr:hypothetical protein [Algoriphagus mannitolivorans]
MNTQNDIHILQFGTGNFLRAFFESMNEEVSKKYNPLNICIIQSTNGNTLEKLKAHHYQFPIWISGSFNGQVIDSIQEISCIKDGLKLPEEGEKFLNFASSPSLKWIVSNVTEAGMVWKNEGPFEKLAESFAGRITQWLYRRFQSIPLAETVIFPLELIPNNGELLREFVLKHAEEWNLGQEFLNWLDLKVTFFTSLVDRIVPGFPKCTGKELQVSHPLLVHAEPYSFWAIKGKKYQAHLIPWLDCGSEVILEESIEHYALRKIRILNGAHTFMAAHGLCLGIKTVREYVENPKNLHQLDKMVTNEIIPFLPIDGDELKSFYASVVERFSNPSIEHRLEDIMMNSVSKFKSRLLPLIQPFRENHHGGYPVSIGMGIFYLIYYYLHNPDKIRDTQEVKNLFTEVPNQMELKSSMKTLAEKLFGLEMNESMDMLCEIVLQEMKEISPLTQSQDRQHSAPSQD